MNQNSPVVADGSDGISVAKELNRAEFTFPAVEYTIESDRATPAIVSFRETLPDGVTPEQVGFHSQYRSADWQVDGETLAFQAEIDPDAAVTTVLGFRGVDEDRVEDFLEPVDDLAVADASFTRSAASEDDDSPDVADAVADGAGDGESPAARPGDGPGTDGQASGHADPEDGSPSLEARLRHVQADVADLRAYTDALEAFIDESGTARQLLDRLEGRLEAVETRLDTLEGTVERHDETIADLEASTSSLAGDVDAHDEAIDALEDRLAPVESSMQDVEDLSRIVDRLDRLEATVEEVDDWRESIRDALAR